MHPLDLNAASICCCRPDTSHMPFRQQSWHVARFPPCLRGSNAAQRSPSASQDGLMTRCPAIQCCCDDRWVFSVLPRLSTYLIFAGSSLPKVSSRKSNHIELTFAANEHQQGLRDILHFAGSGHTFDTGTWQDGAYRRQSQSSVRSRWIWCKISIRRRFQPAQLISASHQFQAQHLHHLLLIEY